MSHEILSGKTLDETCTGKTPIYVDESFTHLNPEEQIHFYTKALWEMTEKIFPKESPPDLTIKIQVRRSQLMRLGLTDEITDREESSLRPYIDGNRDYNTITINRDEQGIHMHQIYKLRDQDTLKSAQTPIHIDYQLAENLTLVQNEAGDINAFLERGKRLQRIHIMGTDSPDFELPFDLNPVQVTPGDLQRVHSILTETLNSSHKTR
jgi:hypothetical protein